MSFLSQNASTILTLTIEHLWLTGACHVLRRRHRHPRRHPPRPLPALGHAPSSASPTSSKPSPPSPCSASCCPLPWLGDRAARIAIVALTAYALLPILRNTYAGIRGIDPSLIEVARALGLTSRQRLFKIELPLAASIILAGLRTATVTCVGIATIAAAVGAGGLGELIFRGVASVDNRLVLAGAIPAALLALAADAALGLLERITAVKR